MFIPVFLFFFVFFFYLRTHCATFNINDSGETIMVCDLLTISHSPGYPLHTLWGRVNCLLPLGKPMLRVTLCSMWTGTVSVVMAYWVLKMMIKGVLDTPATGSSSVVEAPAPKQWLWEVPALFGALTFAFSYQHWFQAGGAKGGIYTLNTLLSVSMLFLFFKMRESGWFIKSFLMMGFLYGLSLAHHWPNQIVMAPAYLWFFVASQKRVPLSNFLKNIVSLRPFDFFENVLGVISAFGALNFIRALTCLLLSVSIYSYLPIRATQNPLVNWWNPQTADRLWGTVMREGYKGVGDMRGWTTIDRDLKRFWVHAHHQFGDVFTYIIYALAVWGFIWLMRKKQWPTAIGLALFGGGVFTGIILFNNPLEGYQWTIDNFFSPVFLTCSMFAAAGIAGLCEWLYREWPVRITPLYASSFFLGLSLIPLMVNYSARETVDNGQITYKGCDQSRYISSYDEGINMLKTVNDDGVILCNGDIDILPLWYLQWVEGKRPKVVSFTMQLIPYEWYRDPLFERWPFLRVPMRHDAIGREDIRPETVVQDMIDQHANDRSFYFTNIFTAPWMRDKNESLPDGFLWRMIKTKNLGYPFSSARSNWLWSTYRLRCLDAPERGYWDEYTDVMKDSYGIGHDFSGYYCFMQKMPQLALWYFNNALKYRQPQTLVRIYMMLGEVYLALGQGQGAIANYQETLRRDPKNPYVYAKLGYAFLLLNDLANAESAFRASLSINPQQKEGLDGLQQLDRIRKIQESSAKKTK
ncbi:MAG TPA: DUF2723 domain-containing protein [bacterium]|nr:DUF2723 domain-containing protein [bacterium]